MKRPFSLGDLVRFKTTSGQYSEGIVIHRIVEKRQPTIFLIECADRRRAFRFETEISLIDAAEFDETNPLGIRASEQRWRLPSSPVPVRMTEKRLLARDRLDTRKKLPRRRFQMPSHAPRRSL